MLPPFVDQIGKERHIVEMHAELAIELQPAHVGYETLNAANLGRTETEEESCQHLESTSTGPSTRQRERADDQKRKNIHLWRMDNVDYGTRLKHQQEKELELLCGSARQFLIEGGLLFGCSTMLDDSTERQDHQGHYNDVSNNRGDEDLHSIPPPSKIANAPAPEIQHWLDCRSQLAAHHRQLRDWRTAYDQGLLEFLYAYPTSSRIDFDAYFMRQTDGMSMEQLEEFFDHKIAALEDQCKAAYDAAAATGSQGETLMMEEWWFDDGEDIASSQASVRSRDVEPKKKEDRDDLILRHLRGMKRGEEGLIEPDNDIMEDSSYEIPALKGLDVLTPADNDLVGVTGSTLSPKTVAETLLKVEAEGKRLRKREFKDMMDGPRYYPSPMMVE